MVYSHTCWFGQEHIWGQRVISVISSPKSQSSFVSHAVRLRMCSERLSEYTKTLLWQNTLSVPVCSSKLAALSIHDGGFFFPTTRAEVHMTDSTTAYLRMLQKLTPCFRSAQVSDRHGAGMQWRSWWVWGRRRGENIADRCETCLLQHLLRVPAEVHGEGPWMRLCGKVTAVYKLNFHWQCMIPFQYSVPHQEGPVHEEFIKYTALLK